MAAVRFRPEQGRAPQKHLFDDSSADTIVSYNYSITDSDNVRICRFLRRQPASDAALEPSSFPFYDA